MADFVGAEWPADSSYTIDSNAHDTATYLAEKALEQSTRDAYDRAARAFDDWRGSERETDTALANYLGVLFDRGLAAASAEAVVAALKDRARRTGVACPAGERTRQTLCGYRRAGAGRGLGQVEGISWEQADRMAELAEQRGTGGLRDALLVRIMSDCLLRGAEAVALDVSDIAFADGWLRVYVRRSKTDQEGRGVVFYAGEETARLARRWLKVADITDGPLFRPVNKAGRAADTRLTVRSVRSIVKRCAENAGIGGRVSGHSLRVGAAQSLRAAGATIVDLMAAGRWTRADTVARYTREQDAASGAVACLRYGAVSLSLRRRATMSALLCESGVTRREWKRRRKDAKRARKADRRADKKAQKALARA
ncbi:MAG: tyrosine-type recombinase/integrase [Gammaproteobacteria bacterium]|nr:tyrosine-type recombinase/integrase [Gammaproteobacteria bacterium]